jgi:putative transposase
MTILHMILTLAALPAHQTRFLKALLSLWLAIPGRVNAINASRYGGWHEQTLRRWFSRPLGWPQLHMALVRLLVQSKALDPRCVLVMDASFIPKSGTHTQGKGSFWSGCLGRAEMGLELSCIALMSWGSHHVFPVSVKQTRPKTEKADRLTQYLSQLRAVFRAHRGWLRHHLRAVVADGQYAKKMFMDAIADEGVAFVTKLASNANLLIPFTGTQAKRRGARQKWAGKVNFIDFAGWTPVPGEKQERVWTRVAWAPHFGRFFRVVVIQRLKKGEVVAHVVLCSTDTTMPAEQIRALYSARFQLEFVFRDAKRPSVASGAVLAKKQFAGLATCQLRSRRGLENHWNASFLSLSLARAELILAKAGRSGRPAGRLLCSIEDVKRRAFNALFAQRILANLGLSQRFAELQNHPSRPLDLGVKAA